MVTGYGFDGEKPSMVNEAELNSAQCILDLVKADTALNAAKHRAPDYTGQWSEKDYYANEQEAFNRAVRAYNDDRRWLIETMIDTVD